MFGMFGGFPGSGGFSPIWLLASVAIGALLNSTQCSTAQARSIEVSVRSEVLTTQEDVELPATAFGHAIGETLRDSDFYPVGVLELPDIRSAPERSV